MTLSKSCSTAGVITIGILCFLNLLFTINVGAFIKFYSSSSLRSNNYVLSSCTLTSNSIVTIPGPPTELYCLSTKYITVWESNGYSVLDSPISSSISESIAQEQLNSYPLNVSLQCLCDDKIKTSYPIIEKYIPCNFYATCFLNIETMNYIQSQTYLNIIGDILLYVGCGSLFIVSILTLISCISRGYCNKCKRKNYTNLDDKPSLFPQ